MKILPLALGLLFAATGLCKGAELSEQPLQQVEVGAHTARISGIATDASGKIVLTSSWDKTARLWELPSGRLIRVFRIPHSEQHGRLYTCALTRDAKLAALAGNTVGKGDGGEYIYILDSKTGDILYRLGPIPEVVRKIAFSEDDRFIAAVGGGWGLRIWDTETWKQVAMDDAYEDADSYGLDWHSNRNIVTTCANGNVRLYEFRDNRLKLLAKETCQFGKSAIAAHFSPDGAVIAVGMTDSQTAAFFDGHTLKSLNQDKSPGNVRGGLYSLDWTSDGTGLVQGGNLYTRPVQVRWWQKMGAQVNDIYVTQDSILDICRSPLAQIVALFAAADPAWGVLRANGEAQILSNAALTDLVRHADEFGASADGTKICMPSPRKERGKYLAFSVAKRELTEIQADHMPETFQKARREGIVVENWRDSTAPQLKGQPLEMLPFEYSHELAISADRSWFLLGTAWNIRKYLPDRSSVWRHPMTSGVTGLSITANDRIIVSSHEDGVIRWWRDDGDQLLSFLLDAESMKWVMWTQIPTSKKVKVASLGIQMANQSEGFVAVEATLAGSPGAAAGLRKGDRISEVDGQPIQNYAQVTTLVKAHRPGDRLQVKAERDGKAVLMSAVLGEREDMIEGPPLSYYDCSPGGGDLLGWHLNHGNEQAPSFFSASRLQNVFYRPDVVAKVLQKLDPNAALVDANNQLSPPVKTDPGEIATAVATMTPPLVRLDTGGLTAAVQLPATEISLRVAYHIRQLGKGRISKVVARLNGRVLQSKDGSQAPLKMDDVMELPLKSDLDGKLSVFAEMTTDVSDDRGNPLRVTSDPATLRLIRDPSVPKEAPRLHVLSIGVGDHPPHSGFEKYDHLTHCGADANEIADIFWSQRGKDGVFRSDDQLKKVVLAEKEATTGNIRRELRALADKANANDVAIIFFAGHGIIDDQFGYYLGTYDAQTQDPSHTALGGVELGELLDGIKARTLLILETCQAGGAFGSNKRVNSPSDLTGLINHLSSAEQGTIIIAASGDEEKSFEDPKSGGFLKTAIVEHLKSGGGELVSCGDLQRQVMKDVPKILAGTGTKSAGVLPFAKEGTKDQHPYCVMPEAVEDFPIAKRRTETGR